MGAHYVGYGSKKREAVAAGTQSLVMKYGYDQLHRLLKQSLSKMLRNGVGAWESYSGTNYEMDLTYDPPAISKP